MDTALIHLYFFPWLKLLKSPIAGLGQQKDIFYGFAVIKLLIIMPNLMKVLRAF